MDELDELGPVDYLVVGFCRRRRTSPARWPGNAVLAEAGNDPHPLRTYWIRWPTTVPSTCWRSMISTWSRNSSCW